MAHAGGSIQLHGSPVGMRWTRLNASAQAGSSTLSLSVAQPLWRAGQRVLISSSSYNPWQAEERLIQEVQAGGSVVVLDMPLAHTHTASTKAYPRAR